RGAGDRRRALRRSVRRRADRRVLRPAARRRRAGGRGRRLMRRRLVELAFLLLAGLGLLAATATPAHADTIAVAVGGDPDRSPDVAEAVLEWAESAGHLPGATQPTAAQTAALVACYLADDAACAGPIASALDADRVVFIMV